MSSSHPWPYLLGAMIWCHRRRASRPQYLRSAVKVSGILNARRDWMTNDELPNVSRVRSLIVILAREPSNTSLRRVFSALAILGSIKPSQSSVSAWFLSGVASMSCYKKRNKRMVMHRNRKKYLLIERHAHSQGLDWSNRVDGANVRSGTYSVFDIEISNLAKKLAA